MRITNWQLDYDDPIVRHYFRDPDPGLIQPSLAESDRVVTKHGEAFYRLRNNYEVLAVYDELDRYVPPARRPDLYDEHIVETIRRRRMNPSAIRGRRRI